MTAEHGIVARYVQDKCRCAPCTHRRNLAAGRRAESAERLGLLPHGTDMGYKNYECRCDRCTDAHRVEKKRQRDAKREAAS